MLETFATIKQFENIYYEDDFKSAVNLGYHIGSLLVGIYYFPKLFTKLFEKREDVIKELAKEFIQEQYGEIKK